MLSNTATNFKLANEVLKKIKEEVISLNDIIPHTELPFFIPKNRDQYITQFGNDKIERYESHNELTEKIRKKAATLSSQFDQEKFSTSVSKQLGITMCGVGECGETSYLAAIRLIQSDCQPQVNLIECQGKVRRITQNGIDFYDHAFVIIGDMGEELNLTLPLVETLKSLKDNCIILDPSLGIVVQANQVSLVNEITNYFNIFGINKINSIIPIITNDSKEITETISQQAKKIGDQIKEELSLESKIANKMGESFKLCK